MSALLKIRHGLRGISILSRIAPAAASCGHGSSSPLNGMCMSRTDRVPRRNSDHKRIRKRNNSPFSEILTVVRKGLYGVRARLLLWSFPNMPGLCMRASAACPRVRASLPRPTGGRKADAHSQACIKSLQCRTAAGRGKLVTHLLAQPNDDVTPASQQPDEAQPDKQFRLTEPPAQTASRGNQSECQHIVALRLYNNEEKAGPP